MRFYFSKDEYELLRSALIYLKGIVSAQRSYPSKAYKSERIADVQNLTDKLNRQIEKGKTKK